MGHNDSFLPVMLRVYGHAMGPHLSICLIEVARRLQCRMVEQLSRFLQFNILFLVRLVSGSDVAALENDIDCLGDASFLTEIVQGCTKRLFPGFEKLGEKVAFCLPTAGGRTLFFSPHFHATWEAPPSAALYI